MRPFVTRTLVTTWLNILANYTQSSNSTETIIHEIILWMNSVDGEQPVLPSGAPWNDCSNENGYNSTGIR